MKVQNEEDYQELIEEKTAKKYGIMSDKQIKLAEQYPMKISNVLD